MAQQIEEEFQIILSKCSSNISYGSLPIVRLYSMNSVDDDIYKRIHQKFLTTSEIYSNILVLAQKLVEKTNLDQDLVLILLHKYKWDEQKFENQYFSEQNQEEYHTKLLVKKKSHIQQKVDECPVCQNNKPLVFSTCAHAACLDCWRAYMNIQLPDKTLFKCIDSECSETLYHSFVMRVLEIKNKYLRSLSIQYARSVKTISACPGADCQLFFQDTSLLVKSVLCQCGTRYCFKCQSQPHEPCSCKERDQWNKITKSQKPNEAWLKTNTKICPGCSNNIERALGCNLIVCKCGVNFCYNCGKIWDEHHKDHFRCPSILTKVKSKFGQDQAQTITLLYSKFVIANSIEKNSEKQYIESDKMIKLLSTKLQVAQSDTLFIKLLCNTIVKGYSYIKWTEVLEYLKRSTIKHEDLLSFRLQKLRQQVEKCSYVLVDFKSKMNGFFEEQSNEFLGNKGGVLKKFYQEKQIIQKIIKQTELEMGQFISDIKNI